MTVVSSDNELAFVGLGGMGAGMALCLRGAGFPLVVHNRTAAKAAPLAEAGARVAASGAEAAHGARIVILSLSDQAAVEEVLFGELAGRLRPGALVVDTSTVSPAYSADATERLARTGARRVEACVLGNPAMARAGKLRIFTAGRREDAAGAHDVLEALGQDVLHVGPAGSACVLKLSFNLILGNQIAALAEAVLLADSAGLDRDLLLTAVTKSGFSSPTLAFRAELMRTRHYEPPAFRSALMEKDLRLAVGEAALHGLELPVTAGAADRFTEAVLAGDGDKDAAVVAELRSTVR
ncbi:3-hydroxyisobutyrate dehydrogenase family protein [Streptosporangium roseum DSM 43021]|uniref:3-hydroxyisobutyrate dehydrogenase family protein n=1 Tax=Streptosporangium roseum (strain ATCC 12428 / DSM 43021 / JCM 3005 / KCTC 9067 / NCIMB 10171 / NRRL 2505 / NI 9100) TaxID=479432 RepID=D2AY41_STRRD|nr:3-hydroxyisobutyrate dehydrogenase family protein [Streptosporangium roseum DSM 43021]